MLKCMQAQDVQLTKQRCRAAALGALVADAACQGLYWYLGRWKALSLLVIYS